MFVRWKQYKRKTARRLEKDDKGGWKAVYTCRSLLTAVLVHSERRDGKPRQKIVAYLGSIAEQRITDIWPRKHFWEAVDSRLDSLNLDATKKREVEAVLLARVVRPTGEEIDAAKREHAEAMRALNKSMGRG